MEIQQDKEIFIRDDNLHKVCKESIGFIRSKPARNRKNGTLFICITTFLRGSDNIGVCLYKQEEKTTKLVSKKRCNSTKACDLVFIPMKMNTSFVSCSLPLAACLSSFAPFHFFTLTSFFTFYLSVFSGSACR